MSQTFVGYASSADTAEPSGSAESTWGDDGAADGETDAATDAAGRGNGRDCNENGIADDLEIAMRPEEDCNGNGVPDECDGGLLPYITDCNVEPDPGRL